MICPEKNLILFDLKDSRHWAYSSDSQLAALPSVPDAKRCPRLSPRAGAAVSPAVLATRHFPPLSYTFTIRSPSS